MRIGDWKVVFAEQRAKEFDVWREQFHTLRIPQDIFHLRRDPFERADEHSNIQRLVGAYCAAATDHGAGGVTGLPRDLEFIRRGNAGELY